MWYQYTKLKYLWLHTTTLLHNTVIHIHNYVRKHALTHKYINEWMHTRVAMYMHSHTYVHTRVASGETFSVHNSDFNWVIVLSYFTLHTVNSGACTNN